MDNQEHQHSPPPPQPTDQAAVVAGAKNSGLAIASLVCGILGFLLCGVTSLPAVITGHLALGQVKKSGGAIKGRGMAIGGLVTGYIILAIFPIAILAGLATPAIFNAKKAGELTKETHEMRMTSVSFIEYYHAHEKWPETLDDLVTEGLVSQDELDDLIEAKADEGTDWVYLPEASYEANPAHILMVGPASGDKRPLLYADGAVKQMSVADAAAELAAQGGRQESIPVQTPTP